MSSIRAVALVTSYGSNKISSTHSAECCVVERLVCRLLLGELRLHLFGQHCDSLDQLQAPDRKPGEQATHQVPAACVSERSSACLMARNTVRA